MIRCRCGRLTCSRRAYHGKKEGGWRRVARAVGSCRWPGGRGQPASAGSSRRTSEAQPTVSICYHSGLCRSARGDCPSWVSASSGSWPVSSPSSDLSPSSAGCSNWPEGGRIPTGCRGCPLLSARRRSSSAPSGCGWRGGLPDRSAGSGAGRSWPSAGRGHRGHLGARPLAGHVGTGPSDGSGVQLAGRRARGSGSAVRPPRPRGRSWTCPRRGAARLIRSAVMYLSASFPVAPCVVRGLIPLNRRRATPPSARAVPGP